ncbi:glycosyltransferase [uncultured Tenacibaculum sp.]|uniref:glycosyltransferase n=1 Tax=uncultured Tenacibaculum sp. TaxID=174713 RepID=UPI002616513B|nr:glycosyltransferase [uncultured Tenacibaculum sp.]
MTNNQLNITIISPFFFPEPISTGKFNTEMALALKEKGHHVKVLCFHPFYPSWKISKSSKQIDGIEIIRGGKFLRFPNNATLRRVILEISFCLFILRNILKLRKNTDIIIPVFPPSLAFYFTQFFFKKSTKKVGMIHDLQEIYANQKTSIISKVIAKSIHVVEKGCYQSCDSLIFLSQEMKDFAQSMYDLPTSKLKVQYPFITIDSENFTNDLEDILPNTYQHIVYSGALGEKQNPQGLYNLFDFCSEQLDGVLFHIFSQGNHFEELKGKNKNTKIKFHSLVPKNNIEELYRRSNIQIVPQLAGTSKGSLPSKLPNLLVSGVNVVCITDKGSEIELLFKKNNFKTIVTSWDTEKIKDIFEELLKDDFDKSNQIEVSKKLFLIDSMIDKILN